MAELYYHSNLHFNLVVIIIDVEKNANPLGVDVMYKCGGRL